MRHFCVWIGFIALAATAQAGEFQLEPKRVEAPAVTDDAWHFTLALPGWATWQVGDMGVNGQVAHIDLDPEQIIRHFDMVADVRVEAQKGRFSMRGELLYFSLSDGIGSNRAVKKLDFQLDQTLADVGVGWRLLESKRGYVDVIGGVRYMNLYQKVALQPNDQRIDALAGKLAVAGTAVQVLEELRALRAENPTVPIAPLFGAEPERLAKAIGKVKGTTAERQAKIAELLHHSLSQTVGRLDDWFDPYIGLRGRVNFSERFYATIKGDVGGFGVGSKISWTAEGGLGFQLTPRLFTEIGYRAWGVDYEQDGLLMNTVTHGFQLTTGLIF